MDKIVFSSSELPAELDDSRRFKLWRDLYCAKFGEAEISRQPDRPFFAHHEFMQIGAIGLTRFELTLERIARTPRQAAADRRDDFLIGFNRYGRQLCTQRSRELDVILGQAIFYTNGEPGEALSERNVAVTGLCLPRALLMELVPNAEDLTLSLLDLGSEATAHLARYVDFLLTIGSVGESDGLSSLVQATLLDLVALSLGAKRDAQELAAMRGLRAARFRAILVAIEAAFSDPSFSVHDVALGLGLNPRYIQNLLSETDANFTERVMELRLQNARAILTSPQGDRMKISDIAYSCGFNEVSYFNRCFRRRFGASPTQYRGNGNGDAG